MRIGDFLCRLFGQISMTLLNRAKGWAAPKERVQEQPAEILPFDVERKQQA
jgi:hypothetical protein